MSRTYQHRPYWVLLADPTKVIEQHNHRFGPCDLPTVGEYAHLVQSASWHEMRDRRCHYQVRWQELSCGCGMCTERDWHKQCRRRSRHVARLALRMGDYDRLESASAYHYDG